MSDISVGPAISAGFEIIRRKPLAVWFWGLANIALVALGLTFFGAAFAPLLSGRLDPQALENDPTAMFGMMAQMQGGQLLLSLGRIGVQAVVMAAAFRAVLQPGEGRWAYMRLGMAELYLVVLIFGAGIAVALAIVAVAIPIGLMVAALAVAKAVAAAVIVGILAVVGVIAGVVYIALRFALAGPMIVADNQFRLTESWQLTKGRVWPLFLTGLVIAFIVMGLWLLIVGVFTAVGLGGFALMLGGMGRLQEFMRQPPLAIAGALAPIALILGVVFSFVIGAFQAIAAGPWAEIYRQLAPPDAKTFA